MSLKQTEALSAEYDRWCEQENLPKVSADEQAGLDVRQREWCDLFVKRWDAASDDDYANPPMTPERVAALANLIIDSLEPEQLAALRLGRMDDAIDAAITRACLRGYAYMVADCHVDMVMRDGGYGLWSETALTLARLCHWATPYRMEVIDAKSGESVLTRDCTLGYFTEDAQFSYEEMAAINALERGATYVKEGATAVLRVSFLEG
jgi:hypothetical protein